MNPLRIALVGATGRMGGRLAALAREDPSLRIVAAVAQPGSPGIGADLGAHHHAEPLGVPVTGELEIDCDVLIDFSTPEGFARACGWARQRCCALVSGTTGLDSSAQELLTAAARSAPVLWSANMSLGVAVLRRLAAEAALALGPAFDIEIVETHHSGKQDAPSGTAVSLYHAICEATGRDPRSSAEYGRHGGMARRAAGAIGIHAVRMGDHVGEHEVHFSGAGESLCLRHRAHDRNVFAAGALRAARWLAGRPSGRYRIEDVLGAADAG